MTQPHWLDLSDADAAQLWRRHMERTGGEEGCAGSFGRDFDDFRIGAVYKHGPGFTVDPSIHHLFCAVTRNHHPLHTNQVFAAGTKQGQRVVVGNQVESSALGLSVPDVSGRAIANLEMAIKFLAATFEGDTLVAESEVKAMKLTSSKKTGTVTVEMRVYAFRGKEADWKEKDDRQQGVHVCTVVRTVLVKVRDASRFTDLIYQPEPDSQ